LPDDRRTMSNFSPFIPIVAAFVAAILAFLFGRRVEFSKHYRSLRTEAYVDFLGAVAELAVFQRTGEAEKGTEARARLAAAKARIAIYGSPPVTAKAAKFFVEHGELSTPAGRASFLAVAAAMRSEGDWNTSALQEDVLEGLLFR
jgi:hypothetical protein